MRGHTQTCCGISDSEFHSFYEDEYVNKVVNIVRRELFNHGSVRFFWNAFLFYRRFFLSSSLNLVAQCYQEFSERMISYVRRSFHSRSKLRSSRRICVEQMRAVFWCLQWNPSLWLIACGCRKAACERAQSLIHRTEWSPSDCDVVNEETST